MKENHLVILLGGNLGDRINNLQQALSELTAIYGAPLSLSSVYETAAWGKENQPNFLNQVAVFKCLQSALEALEVVLSIETKLGRTRNEKWGSRIIDIDILFFNNEIVIFENLKIPHPFLHLRKFTLKPLTEILPDFVHPQLGITMRELLINIEKTDKLKVEKF